jgi:hypothetical protein
LIVTGMLATASARAAVQMCESSDPNDISVRVGSWCVDRYEAVVCDSRLSSGAFAGGCISPTNGNNGTNHADSSSNPEGSALDAKIDRAGRLIDRAYRAYSVAGLVPTRYVSYPQALAACLNAGKTLVPDSVWLAASLGTFAPGANDGLTNSRCNTLSQGAPNYRATGMAGSVPGGEGGCISQWGAEDMVGNFWEWTDAVSSVSATSGPVDHSASPVSGLALPAALPAGKHALGIPGAHTRGGSFGWGATSSPWSIVYLITYERQAWALGFRCARPYLGKEK